MIMKLFTMIIMLIALYLLYRIAYPKQALQKSNDFFEKKAKSNRSVIGKSRFVLPDRSQPVQTSTASLKTDNEEDNAPTFASETEKQELAVVPPNMQDNDFEDEPNPEDLEIEDEDEDDIDVEAEEESERYGQKAMLAAGLDFEDLQQATIVVREQPDTVSDETAETLAALENTDMFEILVSGNEGKRNWIKAIIDRNIQNVMPETESKTSDTEYGDFDVNDFISK
jgi:hypothetical protein